jgi:hypothetical protein
VASFEARTVYPQEESSVSIEQEARWTTQLGLDALQKRKISNDVSADAQPVA